MIQILNLTICKLNILTKGLDMHKKKAHMKEKMHGKEEKHEMHEHKHKKEHKKASAHHSKKK